MLRDWERQLSLAVMMSGGSRDKIDYWLITKVSLVHCLFPYCLFCSILIVVEPDSCVHFLNGKAGVVNALPSRYCWLQLASTPAVGHAGWVW